MKGWEYARAIITCGFCGWQTVDRAGKAPELLQWHSSWCFAMKQSAFDKAWTGPRDYQGKPIAIALDCAYCHVPCGYEFSNVVEHVKQCFTAQLWLAMPLEITRNLDPDKPIECPYCKQNGVPGILETFNLFAEHVKLFHSQPKG